MLLLLLLTMKEDNNVQQRLSLTAAAQRECGRVWGELLDMGRPIIQDYHSVQESIHACECTHVYIEDNTKRSTAATATATITGIEMLPFPLSDIFPFVCDCVCVFWDTDWISFLSFPLSLFLY